MNKQYVGIGPDPEAMEAMEEPTPNLAQRIGPRIKAWREERGITPTDLEEAGIARSVLWRLERGENTTLQTVDDICFLIGLDPAELFTTEVVVCPHCGGRGYINRAL